MSLTIALQLYTVRDLANKDFPGTMKQVAKIGYKYVELAGFGNLTSASEAKKALDDAGLKAAGTHAGIDPQLSNVAKVLDDCQTLGVKNAVYPWIPAERRKTAADWKKIAADLNQIGKQCRDRGMQFGYHNHDFEFQKYDGKVGLDILWENTEPAMVKSELDVYWVKFAGVDPVAYLKQLGKRLMLVHLKDMTPGTEKKFAPVGTGILDFKTICAEAERAGIQYGIVEQDNCYDTPPLEAIRVSYENLKKLGLS
jgi:sugar phosphate isomerase/epimerase